MSHKFFSLIYGKPHSISSNKKIIPAKEISQVIEAEEILIKVKEDAEQYKLEVAKECETLKSLAEQEGFAVGYEQWTKYIKKLEDEIANVHKELVELVIPVALKAAKKIVGKELELSENTVVDIVSNVLKTVSQHKKVTIYVNKKDLNFLETERPRLKEIFEALEALSIRERNDISRGGCVIETEGGIINAQLENQWSALERAFATLGGKLK